MKRLDHIISLIKPYSKVTDIGGDHGYLSIRLNVEKKCQVMLSEISQGPLDNARRNIEKYHAEVQTVLADGLSAITNQQVIVIAGMGGNLISKILEEGRDKITEEMVFYLQPNNNIISLRAYLNGRFQIIDESIIMDGRYYHVIVCRPGPSTYTEKEIVIGPILLKTLTAPLIHYLQQEIVRLSAHYHQSKNTNQNLKRLIDIMNEVVW